MLLAFGVLVTIIGTSDLIKHLQDSHVQLLQNDGLGNCTLWWYELIADLGSWFIELSLIYRSLVLLVDVIVLRHRCV